MNEPTQELTPYPHAIQKAWEQVHSLERLNLELRQELRTAKERSARVFEKYAELLETTANYLDLLDQTTNTTGQQNALAVLRNLVCEA